MALGIEAAIFDLDGTLVDTLQDIANAANHALAAHGFAPLAAAAYRSCIGQGAHQLFGQALGTVDCPLLDALVAEFRDCYGCHLVERSAPYPGVREVLAGLQARALPMCVLSNKLDELAVRIVAELLPEIRFVRVVGERPDRPRKPDPTVALELARAMGVPAARCALIGDSRFDMLAAQRGGLRAIAVGWGLGDLSELRASGYDALADRPEQLLELLSLA